MQLTLTLTLEVLGGLVCCLWLHRVSRTVQDSQAKLRQLADKHRELAEECRRLNEHRLAVHTARWQRGECPHCASPLSKRDWYLASTIVDERPDGD